MSQQYDKGRISLDLTNVVANPVLKKLLNTFATSIKALTKISVFEMYLNQIDDDKSTTSFWEKWLRYLQIYCKNITNNNHTIPKTGATIFIANDPLGILNHIALAAIIIQTRAHVKIIANNLLQPFFGLTEDIIGIESFENKESINENTPIVIEIMQWLKQEEAIIIFPSDQFNKAVLEQLQGSTSAKIVQIYFHARLQNEKKDFNNLQVNSLRSIRNCLKHRGSTLHYIIR